MLLRRLRCLELVKVLAWSLGGPGEAVGQSCETAECFFDYAVKNVWENFEQLWEECEENLDVAAEFPFNAFFEGAGKSLVDGGLEKEEVEAEAEAMQKDRDDDNPPQAEQTPDPLFPTPTDAVDSVAHAQFLFTCVECLFEWVREGTSDRLKRIVFIGDSWKERPTVQNTVNFEIGRQ
ncbi:hypothetical protein BLNAU_24711 [Blattamonas nauphoetae]|uniref:Uncharacterized protein n=1 Tax=Blattamonas nauphoetae TaxID=2049346 RepID=A0ABQ9WQS1_9EUKA|nr:hypothetical protein BLNAU_24711 [Blattamonas nauphoetae]